MRDTIQQGKEMENEGVTIALVGKDSGFITLDQNEINELLLLIKEDVPAVVGEAVVAMETN